MTCESGYDSGRRRLRARKAGARAYQPSPDHSEPRHHLLVVLLPGGIPQRELDALPIDVDVGDIVFKHGRDVDLAERSNEGRVSGDSKEPDAMRTSGNMPLEKTMRRHVLPQAPSPGKGVGGSVCVRESV